MLKLGVIGYPIGHSLSPVMHTAALRALGIAGEYTATAIAPEQLFATLPALLAQGYRGLNVTIPHKQAVLPLMDSLSDSARAIGAVNTIVVTESGLAGHNTDAPGFMRGLTDAGFNAAGASVLVLGAGGSARAVVYALKLAGARVTIWNRTRERAAQLAGEFGVAQIDSLPARASRGSAFELLVNTTSVGMMPNGEAAPLSLRESGIGVRYVYDLVYRPRETVLLREARTEGARTIGGIEMLVYQGAESFRLWTGQDAPVEAMRESIFNFRL